MCCLPVQVALLDVNEAAAESLMESLNKEYGQGRALFLKCDVESEEQMKGNKHNKVWRGGNSWTVNT